MKPEKLVNKLLPVLFEDDHLLAVTKPAGLDVGGMERTGPPGVVEILAALRPGSEPLHVTNRLSRFESGALILAKTAGVSQQVRSVLKSGKVIQEYFAVVLGRMKQDRLTVGEKGAGRTAETQRRPAERPRKRASAIAAPPNDATTLVALDHGEKRTLVRCRTTATTTHSLRAQLRSVRLRLLGDLVHADQPQRWSHDRTCLHLGRITILHPKTRAPLTITSPPLDDFRRALHESLGIERALHAALARRLPCLTRPGLDAFRLLTGDFEDLAGLTAERFGDIVVLTQTLEREKLSASLRNVALWYRETLGTRTVYLKQNLKSSRPALREDITDPKPLLGKPAPHQFEINEDGLRFAIRVLEGLSVGLFLDHRENRGRVRSLAGGRDVLNLFAYTCGFSVAAAVGGAKSTVSVDLSPRALEWGRANLELNGIDLASHEFIQNSAFDYLHLAARDGRAFDMVILDPPSFAHGRKKGEDFQVARDLPGLVTAASAVLRPGGIMMVSTNFRRLPLSGLRELARHGLRTRRHKVTDAPPLPVDFAIDPDHAKTIFVEVS